MKLLHYIRVLKYRVIITLVFGAIVFGGSSCENIYDEPTDNVDEATEFAVNLHAPIGLFETIGHVATVFFENGFYQSNADTLGDHIGAKIQLIDSVFVDDDSAIFMVSFEKDRTNRFDRRFRQGYIKVVVFYDYTEIGSKINVNIDSQNPFILELQNGSIFQLDGPFTMERMLDEMYRFDLTELKLSSPDGDVWDLNGNIDFKLISGNSAVGWLDDLVELQGKGLFVNSEETHEWEIVLPLRMRYEFGCSEYVHKGMIRLLSSPNRYTIDFDPFETGACNKIIKITKGGNQFEVVLP